MNDFEASIRALVSEAVRDELGDIDERIRTVVREELVAHRLTLGPRESRKLRFTHRYPNQLCDKPGMVYAFCLIPEVFPFRIKLGYTQGTIADRLRAYTTACPTTMPIGAWTAHPHDEKHLLASMPGRIGRSEVFVVENVEAFLARADHIMSQRAEASSVDA